MQSRVSLKQSFIGSEASCYNLCVPLSQVLNVMSTIEPFISDTS